MSDDPAVLLGLDWGTSTLRANLIDATGKVLATRAAPSGIQKVRGGAFEGALRALADDWLQPGRPVLASGMIGSRQGWLEAPYCECPAHERTLAQALVTLTLDGAVEVAFVPGLSLDAGGGVRDVMRGEETQVLGALAGAPEPALFVLPGTHSKWVLAEDGRIVWFATFMSGELFAILCEHSILGRLMSGQEHDPGAFAQGLEMARGDRLDGGLLRQLFSARTLPLFDALPATGVHAYLSGLLLGHEIAAAGECLRKRRGVDSSALDLPVTVIGEPALGAAYVAALHGAGITAHAAPAGVTAAGQLRVARAAGWVAR